MRLNILNIKVKDSEDIRQAWQLLLHGGIIDINADSVVSINDMHQSGTFTFVQSNDITIKELIAGYRFRNHIYVSAVASNNFDAISAAYGRLHGIVREITTPVVEVMKYYSVGEEYRCELCILPSGRKPIDEAVSFLLRSRR